MRAAIFIDGACLINLLKSVRATPDYSQLAEYLLAPLRKDVPLDLLRCYFYYCAPWMSTEPTEDELRRMEAYQAFTKEITDIDRWQLKLGKLQKRREGNKEYFEQKRVDVLLSIDMVRHSAAGHIQHAILVAGDSDFIPAVAAAKDAGVTLTLWCAKDTSVHNDLKEQADEVHYFDWRHFPKKEKEGAKGPALAAVSKEGGALALAAGNGDGNGQGQVAREGAGRRRRRGGRGRGRNKGEGQGGAAAASGVIPFVIEKSGGAVSASPADFAFEPEGASPAPAAAEERSAPVPARPAEGGPQIIKRPDAGRPSRPLDLSDPNVRDVPSMRGGQDGNGGRRRRGGRGRGRGRGKEGAVPGLGENLAQAPAAPRAPAPRMAKEPEPLVIEKAGRPRAEDVPAMAPITAPAPKTVAPAPAARPGKEAPAAEAPARGRGTRAKASAPEGDGAALTVVKGTRRAAASAADAEDVVKENKRAAKEAPSKEAVAKAPLRKKRESVAKTAAEKPTKASAAKSGTGVAKKAKKAPSKRSTSKD